MNEIRTRHAASARSLAWEKTAIGIRYSCDRCSWHVSMPNENLSEAERLFKKHDCAENPSKNNRPFVAQDGQQNQI